MNKLIAKTILFFRRVRRGVLRFFLKSLFSRCGDHVSFSPDDNFSYSRIKIGSDVYIGPGANFSTITSIVIGSKVMFGPGVSIMGGDYNTGTVGVAMYDVKVKRPENDSPVIIEDDVWIGANVTILKGVTIHSGSIVAAGSVVTRDVPFDAVVAGVPAKVLRYRFEGETLNEHRKMLGRQ